MEPAQLGLRYGLELMFVDLPVGVFVMAWALPFGLSIQRAWWKRAGLDERRSVLARVRGECDLSGDVALRGRMGREGRLLHQVEALPGGFWQALAECAPARLRRVA